MVRYQKLCKGMGAQIYQVVEVLIGICYLVSEFCLGYIWSIHGSIPITPDRLMSPNGRKMSPRWMKSKEQCAILMSRNDYIGRIFYRIIASEVRAGKAASITCIDDPARPLDGSWDADPYQRPE